MESNISNQKQEKDSTGLEDNLKNISISEGSEEPHEITREQKKTTYFHRNSKVYHLIPPLTFPLHSEKNNNEEYFPYLKDVEKFSEVDSFTVNHLVCKIFCIVDIDVTKKSEKNTELFESFLYTTQKNENKTKINYFHVLRKGEPVKLVERGNLERGRYYQVLDFVPRSLSKKSTEAISKCTNPPYTWVTKEMLSINDSNHSESLVLHVLKNNLELFFNLVPENLNRSDYSFLGFGIRFFSSLDSCDSCNEKILNEIPNFEESLHEIMLIKEKMGYKRGYPKGTFPLFRTFFYSARPYKYSKYTLIEEAEATRNGKDSKVFKVDYSKSPKPLSRGNYFLELFSEEPNFDEILGEKTDSSKEKNKKKIELKNGLIRVKSIESKNDENHCYSNTDYFDYYTDEELKIKGEREKALEDTKKHRIKRDNITDNEEDLKYLLKNQKELVNWDDEKQKSLLDLLESTANELKEKLKSFKKQLENPELQEDLQEQSSTQAQIEQPPKN